MADSQNGTSLLGCFNFLSLWNTNTDRDDTSLAPRRTWLAVEEGGHQDYITKPWVDFENYIYAFGSMNTTDQRVYRQNKETLEWALVEYESPYPLVQRRKPSAALHGHHVYLFGGCIAQHDNPHVPLARLDLPTMAWDFPQTENSPGNIAEHSACVIDDVMYVYGGCLAFEESKEFHALDLKTFVWKSLKPKGKQPPHRRRHGACSFQGKMYVCGGSNVFPHNVGGTFLLELTDFYVSSRNGKKADNKIYEYNPKSNTWKVVYGLKKIPVFPEMTVCGDTIWIYGGRSDSFGSPREYDVDTYGEYLVLTYKPADKSWHDLSPEKKCRPPFITLSYIINSRIYVISMSHDDLNNLECLVLDLSLKKLCAKAILKYRLDTTKYPKIIQKQIMEANGS